MGKLYHRLGGLRDRTTDLLRNCLAWLLLPGGGQGPAAYGTRHMQAALEADLRLTERVTQSQVLKYNAVFAALADGMLITNPAGIITEANPAACALWGLPLHRLLGRGYGELFPPADARAIETGAFPDGRPIQLESTLYPATGDPVPVQVTALPFANAGEAGRVLLVKDISERRKTEAIVRASREVENAINYFATSLYGHNTVDEILWDIVKNCIARLGFVDCIVYLTDASGDNLVQRAAYGPKNPQDFQILSPLVLPVGQGIVGSVARSGVAEIVADTLLDPRYVIDDEVRRSEITVPVIYQDKVIGIIDSEHPDPGFFKPQHLNILTTIASLCANKIVRVQAEEEARRTELQLAEYRRKMAEFKLMALRAQMNPHFVFNSLNSIQHLIAGHERQPALTYLSTFSRLLRQILESSLNSQILLAEEIVILEKYLSLESLRFTDRFSYQITVDPALDPADLEMPALLVQPYVENALLHGLLNKPGPGRLTIHFEDAHPYLRCTIEDDGIGRAAAAAIKSRKITGHQSVGMMLTEERLDLINGNRPDKVLVQITDLTDGTRATGTRVVIHVPVDSEG
jgi:PAS domain S-box-containing protein